MPQGKIKKLVSDRGFGFIASHGDDLFFHHSAVEGVAFEDLKEGDLVDYEKGEGRQGPCAVNVRLTPTD